MKTLTIATQAYLHNALLVATLATLSFLLLVVRPPWLFSGVTFTVIACGAFLFALLFVVSASQRSQGLDAAKSYLRLALVVWWALLISEQVFSRVTPETESFAGHFSEAAYGEAAFWALAFLALLLIMPRPQYLRQAFSDSNKWLSLFAVVCLISAPFSPTLMYSLAWAFKLFLVALLLLLCSATMHDLDDIEAFLWANFWGFVIMTVVPVARAFADPSTAFDEDGRLSASADGLSLIAGTLVLFALTLNSLRKRTWLLGFAFLGATVMIMSGGKAGIAAGIASVTLFYVMQKRVAAGFGWLLGVLALGGIILLTTPLATHFITYHEQGQLSTITGRTDLWKAVWPEIMQHPIVGHGYLASRFLSEQVEGTFGGAGHTHNGFIEALYNNGLVGLCILVGIHFVIVKNLWRAIKDPPNRNAHLLAVGSSAIYVNLLINGLFNATFGGRASTPFMLLLGLLIVSEVLRRITRLPVRLSR
jgi:O-antigen ligase